MRVHNYRRKNESDGARYTFFELENAVRVVRELHSQVREHIFFVGDFVQGRTLKKFDFEGALANGHSVYVTSEEHPSSNAQSLAAQIDFIIDASEGADAALWHDLNSVIFDKTTNGTEKESLIKSRIGQGEFRRKLLIMWGRCSVTSCTTTELLVASHIKPWNVSSNDERLDPYNGLLLVAHLDKAFDSGLVSFNSKGCILISSFFKEHELVGITHDMKISLKQGHEAYLEYHREYVFKNA